MLRRNYIVTLLCIICSMGISACKQSAKLSSCNWLIGTWVSHFPEADVYEQWKRVNDHELAGYSYSRQQGDSIPFEYIQLKEDEQGLYYIVTGARKQNDSSVRFTATQITDGFLQFENPQHDFPTRITYRHVNADSIYAEISGIQAGKTAREGFAMKRMKP